MGNLLLCGFLVIPYTLFLVCLCCFIPWTVYYYYYYYSGDFDNLFKNVVQYLVLIQTRVRLQSGITRLSTYVQVTNIAGRGTLIICLFYILYLLHFCPTLPPREPRSSKGTKLQVLGKRKWFFIVFCQVFISLLQMWLSQTSHYAGNKVHFIHHHCHMAGMRMCSHPCLVKFKLGYLEAFLQRDYGTKKKP